MRCPDCQKFTSLEMQDPEVSNLEVEYNEPADNVSEPTFTITGTVRIVRNCADCGTELKEATLDIEQEVDLGENVPEWTAKTAAAYSARTDLGDATVEEEDTEAVEEGGGRYAKSYFGATVHFAVYLDHAVIARVEWSDKVAASEMDEMV